jgi:hypothetical protein
MGLTFTKLFSRLFSKKEMRILMVRGGHLAHLGDFLAAPALRGPPSSLMPLITP